MKITPEQQRQMMEQAVVDSCSMSENTGEMIFGAEDIILNARFGHIRPIIFDRYPGNNNTQLEPIDKLYKNAKGQCVIPILNVYSLLTAQNTPSVPKLFYGRKAREMSMALSAFCNIESADEDPFEAVIYKDDKPFMCNDSRIRIMKHVARVKNGIPNPKERPMIPTGCHINLRFTLQPNTTLSVDQLKTMIRLGGNVGLGTFRPAFGRYIPKFS